MDKRDIYILAKKKPKDLTDEEKKALMSWFIEWVSSGAFEKWMEDTLWIFHRFIFQILEAIEALQKTMGYKVERDE